MITTARHAVDGSGTGDATITPLEPSENPPKNAICPELLSPPRVKCRLVSCLPKSVSPTVTTLSATGSDPV